MRRLIPGSYLIAEQSNATISMDFNKIEYTWVIDPIDSTINFIHQFLRYAISIALYNYNDIVFGLTLDILNNILYAARKDQGAFMNDNPLTVSSVHSLKNSLIAYGLPKNEWNQNSHFST